MQPQLPANMPTYVREKISDAIIPVVFAEAVRAIAACRSIDEGKYWADKADALAAWAKIYKNDDAAAESRRLKAHAFRRMSKIAEDLASQVQVSLRAKGGGKLPHGGQRGPAQTLRAAGFSTSEVMRIRRVGNIPDERFSKLMAQKTPPGIQRMSQEGRGHGKKGAPISSQSITMFAGSWSGAANAVQFRHFCRKYSALELARGVRPDEAKAARVIVSELRDWLDEFDASLPLEAPQA